jgi:hypothetical protein
MKPQSRPRLHSRWIQFIKTVLTETIRFYLSMHNEALELVDH